MTPRVGMIEWMNNTTTLKEFLKAAATPEVARYLEGGRLYVIITSSPHSN